jgi:hypothetical protein
LVELFRFQPSLVLSPTLIFPPIFASYPFATTHPDIELGGSFSLLE